MKPNVTSMLQHILFCASFQIPKLTYLRPGAMKLNSQNTEQTSYYKVYKSHPKPKYSLLISRRENGNISPGDLNPYVIIILEKIWKLHKL